MFKFGLKVWPDNIQYLGEIDRLYISKVFDYIELYAYPNTFKQYIHFWQELQIPFVIHAAHFMQGLNLSKTENEKTNLKLAHEAIQYADSLSSDIIIFHPGIDGMINETIRQIKLIGDSRIVIENKPYCSIDEKYTCVGYSPDEIQTILQETGVRFCFDFGHAICAANSKHVAAMEYVDQFIHLNPAIYHLTDGNYQSVIDKHLHFGEGNYPIEKILSLVPRNSKITIEVYKSSQDNLIDFEKDIEYLTSIRNKRIIDEV